MQTKKPVTTKYDQIIEGAKGMMFRGVLLSGYPDKSALGEEFRYLDSLTTYELYAYDTRNQHVLCPKCYDKIVNRARFGLCAACYNKEDHTKLPVSDAKNNKIYLSRRGIKVVITGGIIKVPVYENRQIVSYELEMQRPYIDISRKDSCIPDFALKIGEGKWLNLRSHGMLPLEYLLAELD